MDSISVNLENLSEQERESLMKLIEKANKPKSKVWKPKTGERYWSISMEGAILSYVWDNNYFDNKLYDVDNVFREEEAREEVIRRKMLKRWKDLSIESGEDGNPWDGNSFHWYAYLDEDNVRISCLDSTHDANIFFQTREACEAAIGELGKDNVKKYILGIKN